MLHDDLYTVVLRLGNQATQLAADCYLIHHFGTHDCLWYSFSTINMIIKFLSAFTM